MHAGGRVRFLIGYFLLLASLASIWFKRSCAMALYWSGALQ
jgi:hypothetical protein